MVKQIDNRNGEKKSCQENIACLLTSTNLHGKVSTGWTCSTSNCSIGTIIQPPNCSSTLQTRGSIDSHVTCKEFCLTVALPTLHDLTIRHHGICRNCVGAAAPGDLSSDRHDCSTHPELCECVVLSWSITCASQTLAQRSRGISGLTSCMM